MKSVCDKKGCTLWKNKQDFCHVDKKGIKNMNYWHKLTNNGFCILLLRATFSGLSFGPLQLLIPPPLSKISPCFSYFFFFLHIFVRDLRSQPEKLQKYFLAELSGRKEDGQICAFLVQLIRNQKLLLWPPSLLTD